MRLLVVTLALLAACAVSLPASGHAQEPTSLPDLTLAGSVGSTIGLASLTATTVIGGLATDSSRTDPQALGMVTGGFFGMALGLVTLPLWTAGGVSTWSAHEGHHAYYGRALGGAMLGLLTYPVFALPMLVAPRSDAGPITLIFGAFATVLITMPLTSALLVRQAIRHEEGATRMQPLALSFGGSF